MPLPRCRIVFLDALTTSQGDVSWSPLMSLGDFIAYDRTDPAAMGDRALEADIVIVNKFPVNRHTLLCMPNVRYIVVAATGYNCIDQEAVEERGIPVSNVRDYSTESVAQHVFSLLLDIFNRSAYYNAEVKRGRWATCPDFCFYDHAVPSLAGKVLGIVGYGAIGSRVAEIGHAFGMTVLSTSRDMEKPHPSYVHFVGRDDLFSSADIISLHCALTHETERLICHESISVMKDGAILVNTGRGGLINEEHVLSALNTGKMGWAALDVLTLEPPSATNPLWRHPHAFITPHIAWAGLEARKKLVAGIAENIGIFLSGEIRHRVY